MNPRVFISAYSFKAPGMNTPADLRQAITNPAAYNPVFETMQPEEDSQVLFGQVALDTDSVYYPRRSDQKVMRQDVIAACFSAGELIEKSQLLPEELLSVPLFIANGICLEHQQEEYNLLHKTQLLAGSYTLAEKHQRFYQAIPPLLALRSLTNATESFVAQYSGVAGTNTTFGSSSHSGYYALREAIGQIQTGQTAMAKVGASHASGLYSYLTFKNFTPPAPVRRESVCAAFLLLESEENLRRRGVTPLAEINFTTNSRQAPSLFQSANSEPYDQLPVTSPGAVAIFSGGITETDYEQEKAAVADRWPANYSLYPLVGHLGAASLLMNLITGIHYLREQDLEQVDCLDHDVYGRSCLVQLKREAVI